MSYDLSDYVDVAERISIFREKFPEGSLQSAFQFTDDQGHINGVVVTAYAYRGPDDARPGMGHSFCPIPGKTPYTKDSEIENAETSAWGRAIVAALAADTKRGIASSDEVRSKRDDQTHVAGTLGGSANGGDSTRTSGDHTRTTTSGDKATEKQISFLRRLMADNNISDVGKTPDELTKAEASQLIEQIKAGTFTAPGEAATLAALGADDDIPF